MAALCENRIVQEILHKADSDTTVWISKNINVETLIQNGPQCGLVALCMALKTLQINCTVDDLMEEARNLNFTKKGEIFDVTFLYELAKSRTAVEIVNLNGDIDFFEILLKSKLILIPYDTDRNFEPCNKKGIKAHWALVTGYLVPVHIDDIALKPIINFSDENKPNGLTFVESLELAQVTALREAYKNNKVVSDLIHVICKQGKSRHLGIWNLKKLLESNRQLKEINEEKCDPINFVLPPNKDLSKTLSSKFLVFY